MTAGITREEADNVELRRLYWQCRRGMRELDELLIGFVRKKGSQLSAQDRERFTELLRTPDQQLLEWLMAREQPADQGLVDVIERIRAATAD